MKFTIVLISFFILTPPFFFKEEKIPFNQKEIDRLFEVVQVKEWADTVLIMIYTGMRIGELLELKKEDIDLENKTIRGGIKTEAGKNRLIPISDKIYDLILKRYNYSNHYLIENFKGQKMTYSNYKREKFEPLMEDLGMKHNPHECRHTFATLARNAGADTTSIKRLIGHNSFATTEKFYTHKDIEELKKAIDLL